MLNKVIYVLWINDYGGLERITQLYEKIFQIFDPVVLPLRFKNDGLKYNRLYKLKNKDRLFFIIEYFSFVRKRKESIFHIQYAGSFILLLTYLAGARWIVYHFHGTKFSANFFDRIIWKLLCNKIKTIANSRHTKKMIEEKLNISENIYTIPNLISTSDFSYYKRTYKGEKFIVTYAGRFTKGKNLNLLVEAAWHVKNLDNNNDFEFRLYGEGPDKVNVLNKIKELRLQDYIKIFSFENDINKVYSESHLFIFLSLYESFGNVAAEAILTGLPVICYKIPALEEFISNKNFFLEELDAKILANKIIEFKNNYYEVTEAMESVHNYAAQYLNNEKIVAKLKTIYHELEN